MYILLFCVVSEIADATILGVPGVLVSRRMPPSFFAFVVKHYLRKLARRRSRADVVYEQPQQRGRKGPGRWAKLKTSVRALLRRS